jgi:hypothetical protein
LTHRRFLQPCLVAAIVALSFGVSASRERFFDFRVFYCAGQAERLGADPYREHPLYECEQNVGAPERSPVQSGVTAPAPFPGFVLALFAALARLPFSVALFVWEGAAVAAVGCAVMLVARTTRTTILANAIALGFPAAVVGLPLGQVTPFILLALAGCGVLLASGKPRWAALAALGAMLDPHVGLALVLGLFIGVRAARSVLVAGTFGLAALGLAVSGPLREWEYLRSVIPAHALAGVADAGQFSVTHFAFIAGARPALAVTLGSLWYAGALVVGITLALCLRARLGSAVMAYVPPAFAVFGGTHTHAQQIALAIPAFMLLYAFTSGRRRAAWVVVTFFAAIPWLSIAPSPWIYLGPPVLAVIFARELECGRHALRVGAAAGVTLGIILLAFSRSHLPRALVMHTVAGNPLADDSWQAFMQALFVPPESWYLVAKAPTVIAFLILFAVLAGAALRKPLSALEC